MATVITYLAHMAMFASLFGGRSDDRDGGNALGGLLLIVLGPARGRAGADGGQPQPRVPGRRLRRPALRRTRWRWPPRCARSSAAPRRCPLPQDERLVTQSHLMIANPFRGQGLASLFSTHPPMARADRPARGDGPRARPALTRTGALASAGCATAMPGPGRRCPGRRPVRRSTPSRSSRSTRWSSPRSSTTSSTGCSPAPRACGGRRWAAVRSPRPSSRAAGPRRGCAPSTVFPRSSPSAGERRRRGCCSTPASRPTAWWSTPTGSAWTLATSQGVVLSHGHFDHAGGLAGLAGRGGRLPLTVHPLIWTRRRLAVPGREPAELPTLSRRALEAEGFAVIERREPSLLVDGCVLITGEIDRTTDFERGMPPPHQAWDGGSVAARPAGARRPGARRARARPRPGGAHRLRARRRGQHRCGTRCA